MQFGDQRSKIHQALNPKQIARRTNDEDDEDDDDEDSKGPNVVDVRLGRFSDQQYVRAIDEEEDEFDEDDDDFDEDALADFDPEEKAEMLAKRKQRADAAAQKRNELRKKHQAQEKAEKAKREKEIAAIEARERAANAEAEKQKKIRLSQASKRASEIRFNMSFK